jgi:hypothetical protein
VRSKRAIVSLSLLSLVLYLGVFCDGDNLWCVLCGCFVFVSVFVVTFK